MGFLLSLKSDGETLPQRGDFPLPANIDHRPERQAQAAAPKEEPCGNLKSGGRRKRIHQMRGERPAFPGRRPGDVSAIPADIELIRSVGETDAGKISFLGTMSFFDNAERDGQPRGTDRDGRRGWTSNARRPGFAVRRRGDEDHQEQRKQAAQSDQPGSMEKSMGKHRLQYCQSRRGNQVAASPSERTRDCTSRKTSGTPSRFMHSMWPSSSLLQTSRWHGWQETFFRRARCPAAAS